MNNKQLAILAIVIIACVVALIHVMNRNADRQWVMQGAINSSIQEAGQNK